MKAHGMDAQERARLQALHKLELLDTPPDPELDRITALAAASLSAPICMVSLVDEHRLVFKSRYGLAVSEFPRRAGFCHHVVQARQPIVATDTRQEPRFQSLDLVTQASAPLLFYAGAPLRFGEHVIGALCVMDHQPRPDFGPSQQRQLTTFAEVVCEILRARHERLEAQRERTLFADGPVAAIVWDNHPQHPQITYRSPNLARVVGEDAQVLLDSGRTLDSLVFAQDADDLRIALRSHRLSKLTQLETIFRLADGERWIQLVSCGDYDEHDRLRHIRGYLSDISALKHLEATVAATKDRLFLALESAQIGTWELDLKTHDRVINARTAAMLGYRADELDIGQAQWAAMVHPYDRARINEAVDKRRVLSGMEHESGPDMFSIEYRMRHKRGHYIWVQSCGKAASRDEEGRPVRVVGTLIDITARKLAEIDRMRQQQVLDLVNTTQRTFLLDKSLTSACETLFEPLLRLTESQFGFIGIVEYDDAGKMQLRVPSISNISWDEPTRLWYEEHMRSAKGIMFTKLDNLFGHVVTHDTVVCTNQVNSHPASCGVPPGHPKLEGFLGVPLRFNNRVMGMIGLGNRPDGYDNAMVSLLEPLSATLGTLIHAREVEEERAHAEALLLAQATSDSLTGLTNRRRFFEVAEGMMAVARRYRTPITVALMDLDHFKRVNDTHGHAAGDAVLRCFADVLREVLRESDMAARIGGEEFAVLMPSTSELEAQIALDRIREQLEGCAIDVGGHCIHVTVSMGVCEWQEDLPSTDAWFARADQALYRAKEEGRNRLCLATTAKLTAA